MEDFSYIEDIVDINNSLYTLSQMGIKERKEIKPIVELLHPNLYKYNPNFSISNEGILGSIKDNLVAAFEWLIEKINKIISMFMSIFKDDKTKVEKEKDKFKEFKENVSKEQNSEVNNEMVYNVPPFNLIKDRMMVLKRFVEGLKVVTIDEASEFKFTKYITNNNFSIFEKIGMNINETNCHYKFIRIENTEKYAEYDGQMTLTRHEQAYKDCDALFDEILKVKLDCMECLKRFKKRLEQDTVELKKLAPGSDEYKHKAYILEAVKVFVRNAVVINADLTYLINRLPHYLRLLENMRKNKGN